MESHDKKHPFKRYTIGHLIYDAGKILDDDQFHRHAENEIENVSVSNVSHGRQLQI